MRITGPLASTTVAAFALLLLGCAQPPAAVPPSAPSPATAGSILVGATPAPGSVVTGPVNQLVLRFSPPARLNEVTIGGPDGAMAMKGPMRLLAGLARGIQDMYGLGVIDNFVVLSGAALSRTRAAPFFCAGQGTYQARLHHRISNR